MRWLEAGETEAMALVTRTPMTLKMGLLPKMDGHDFTTSVCADAVWTLAPSEMP
jgi:hypothetical protein